MPFARRKVIKRDIGVMLEGALTQGIPRCSSAPSAAAGAPRQCRSSRNYFADGVLVFMGGYN